MVPREIFNYTTSRGAAHLLNDFRMPVQVLECRCDRIDIARLHDNSFHAIAHYIARFTRGDLGQCTRCGLVCHFGAAFPLRRKNMYRALVKIILWVAHKSHHPDVIAPKLFKEGLRFVVHVANQPELRIRQIETMPCFEHMLDAFAFDQSTREDSAKFGRPISWLESFHVHSAGQVKKFFLRKTTYAKGVSRPL